MLYNITGTQINYYFVCRRKLWLFSKGLAMEHLSDEVFLGKLIGEEAYPRQKKEIFIDECIKLDFVGEDGIVHEIKKSSKIEKAHEYQLLYYLFCLKKKGIKIVKGKINYPKLREIKFVLLTSEKEHRLINILKDIEEILSLQSPPDQEKKRMCHKCSYYEYCWI